MEADKLISECKKHIGELSLYTGENPDWAWCARFLVACMRDIGMNPPDTWSAKGLYDWCSPLDDNEVKAGDFVVFNLDGREDKSWFDHVGLVLWFDHESNTYRTIEGNSGSNYSVGVYTYDNAKHPPQTYFCRPKYREEDEMTDIFNDVWFSETLNSRTTPQTESYTTPANLLWEIANEVHEIKEKLEKITNGDNN